MSSIKILIKALVTKKAGDWNKAHEIVQDLHHSFAFWIRIYLHRKEPELFNASYRYLQARKTMPDYRYKHESITFLLQQPPHD